MLSNMTTKSIEQRAKARVLFNRIEASNDTTMEVEMVLIPQLRKYLEVSRSEAWVSLNDFVFLILNSVVVVWFVQVD